MITGKTKIFGVIADPIGHVRAPELFNPIFEERGVDAVMIPFHITPDSLESTVRGLAAMPNCGGVCVTNPHKITIASICDELGVVAQFTGAVNVVRFQNGRLHGHNFDGVGFTAGLEGGGKHSLDDKHILIIGAGGAARAIAAALAYEPIASLTISNRTPKKAEDIVVKLKQYNHDIEFRAIDTLLLDLELANFDIIINTTTLGLNDGDPMPCALENVKPDALIADIIMNPPVTRWMEAAEEKGLKTHAGKYMLDKQVELIGKFLGAF